MNPAKDAPSIVPDPQGEFPFQPQDYALHLTSAVALIRDAALDAALRPIGLNVGRYRVLGALSRFGALSMTEVARLILLDRTTLTRVADHLVADELAVRKAAPKDRRQVLLEITDAGRERYLRALPEVFGYNRSLLAGLKEAEIRGAARTMKRLVGNIAPDAIRSYLIDFSPPTRGETP
jgi:DNA-binding MarR family transcriptional regulator